MLKKYADVFQRLSRFSSIKKYSSRYNKYISYYNRKTDEFKTIETTDDTAKIENEYYIVNIVKDSIDYQGTDILVTSSIEHLNTIDKKG